MDSGSHPQGWCGPGATASLRHMVPVRGRTPVGRPLGKSEETYRARADPLPHLPAHLLDTAGIAHPRDPGPSAWMPTVVIGSL